VKDVSPCRTVAARTPSTIGVSSWICRLPMTLSTRYFVEAGSTNPDRRLMAISTKPSASNPRLGFISAQTSGRFFHAFLRFFPWTSFLGLARWSCFEDEPHPALRCKQCSYDYMAKRIGRSSYLQSPAVPARGRLAVAGRSRFKTLEMNSLTVIPRWPQSLRFRLV